MIVGRRTNTDCADICATIARILSWRTGYDANISRTLLETCAMAYKSCGGCAAHAGEHKHCRICADACRACGQASHDLLASRRQLINRSVGVSGLPR